MCTPGTKQRKWPGVENTGVGLRCSTCTCEAVRISAGWGYSWVQIRRSTEIRLYQNCPQQSWHKTGFRPRGPTCRPRNRWTPVPPTAEPSTRVPRVPGVNTGHPGSYALELATGIWKLEWNCKVSRTCSQTFCEVLDIKVLKLLKGCCNTRYFAAVSNLKVPGFPNAFPDAWNTQFPANSCRDSCFDPF
eukprot:2445917-Rhodomonas_salina.1